jgi:hypothetical protein
MDKRVYCRKKAWTSEDPDILVEGEDLKAQQLLCIPGHSRMLPEVERFSNWADFFSEDKDVEFVEGTNKAPDDVPSSETPDPDQPIKIKRKKKEEDTD